MADDVVPDLPRGSGVHILGPANFPSDYDPPSAAIGGTVSDVVPDRCDDAVLASIKLQRYDDDRGCYECGCQQRGKWDQWHLCSYHGGYRDGYDAALEAAFERALRDG